MQKPDRKGGRNIRLECYALPYGQASAFKRVKGPARDDRTSINSLFQLRRERRAAAAAAGGVGVFEGEAGAHHV